MNITERDVAETIHKLIIAGKKMPQHERLSAAANTGETAKAILKETVDLWATVFVPRKIGVERWQKATTKALTLTEAGGVNVNLITPALMDAALRAVECEHLQQAEQQASQEKLAEAQGITTDDYQTRLLLRWTCAKLAERRLIMPYMPTAEQVFQLGRKLGLSDNEIEKQFKLIQIYLNDQNYCNEQGKAMRIDIFIRPDRKVGFKARTIAA